MLAVLGDKLTPSLVVEAAIHGHDLPHEFPQEVLDEATAVPLVVENRITGFLAVTNRTPGRRWRPDEIELMGIVGNNSAVMIEQARLRAEAEATAAAPAASPVPERAS